MKLHSAIIFTCLVCNSVSAEKDILRRHGDYFLRLGNEDGKLVLDEGDILPMDTPLEPPVQYKRSKRIAHVKDYEKFVQQKNTYDYLNNNVNVDSPPEFVGIRGMLQSGSINKPVQLNAEDVNINEIYEKDTAHCLQK